ncbi:hypothetical protein THAOC_25678 [Thalassiosira oceanica]|uniref:DUF6820 domain-containing protein n=1 Tax=Thalassiosira oceanica TaxID=159749 RepID=K0RQQ6_THAOC|nr:hypothetical protein THAOC_25678 [Thalassiosira oceanica]|eukprot:EJK54674.1 hypothetical protein THAOC_25678 [Thalassiosira oceanica]
MVPDGHAALQGLSSIPHLTSVAAAFYRSDIISGSETSAGRARAMMHKFAVAPARLIDNGGRAMGAVIGPSGEAMEELDSPYHRRCAVVPVEPTGCLVSLQYCQENEPKGEIVEQDGECFRGVGPIFLEEMFTWGGCCVGVAKEVPGLVAFPVGTGGGDDVEGDGVGGDDTGGNEPPHPPNLNEWTRGSWRRVREPEQEATSCGQGCGLWVKPILCRLTEKSGSGDSPQSPSIFASTRSSLAGQTGGRCRRRVEAADGLSVPNEKTGLPEATPPPINLGCRAVRLLLARRRTKKTADADQQHAIARPEKRIESHEGGCGSTTVADRYDACPSAACSFEESSTPPERARPARGVWENLALTSMAPLNRSASSEPPAFGDFGGVWETALFSAGTSSAEDASSAALRLACAGDSNTIKGYPAILQSMLGDDWTVDAYATGLRPS